MLMLIVGSKYTASKVVSEMELDERLVGAIVRASLQEQIC